MSVGALIAEVILAISGQLIKELGASSEAAISDSWLSGLSHMILNILTEYPTGSMVSAILRLNTWLSDKVRGRRNESQVN